MHDQPDSTEALVPESPRARRLLIQDRAASCFFRSGAPPGERKALVQITERCNLHCAHCFVSSTRHGADISYPVMRDVVLPRLRRARVTRLTLTGGEPFVHPEVLSIAAAARDEGMSVGVCTNATCISDQQIAALVDLGAHVNVSLDGFRAESHGRFRGDPNSFERTVETTRRLAKAGVLQGLLSTPNALTTKDDYVALARFAVMSGATYVLMNPLSAFGRGVMSRRRLGADQALMNAIRDVVEQEAAGRVEVVPIRFPNHEQPLGGCVAGDIVYVFADGAVAVCPYLVFAARAPASRHDDSEFLVSNILASEIAADLEGYRFHERYSVGANPTCQSCAISAGCGKGCPAAVIAAGGRIGDRDREICPISQ